MIYILTALFLWSSMGIVIRLSGVQIPLLMFSSSFLAVFILGPMLFRREYWRETRNLRQLLYFCGIVPINLLNTLSFFYAYKNTTIANAVLTHYTAPILVACLAPLFLKERLTRTVLTAIVMASCGLWILLDVSPIRFWSLMFAGDRNTIGILAGLLSALAYATVLIACRALSQSLHPLVMTFLLCLITALILLPFVGMPKDFHSLLWASAVMGILHYAIAPILYFKGLQTVTANRAAILGYLEPCSAILLGMVFLGEAITYLSAVGGMLILFSGYLTVRNPGTGG
jgi:drug/metabolite transporter (DMT)-like permease